VSKDPWGNDYQYVYPGTHGKEYDLYSLGADGQPGGEGINADIGNWSDDQQQQQSPQ
jgi:general secretion pathway protein G